MKTEYFLLELVKRSQFFIGVPPLEKVNNCRVNAFAWLKADSALFKK